MVDYEMIMFEFSEIVMKIDALSHRISRLKGWVEEHDPARRTTVAPVGDTTKACHADLHHDLKERFGYRYCPGCGERLSS